MKELHNYKDNLAIGTDTFPYRKKPCLYVRNGNVATKVASFNNDAAVESFWKTLITIVGGVRDNDQG